MSQVFVDHQTLAKIAGSIDDSDRNDADYEAFLESVRQEVYALDSPYRQVIIMYYFENLGLDQITKEVNLDTPHLDRILREGTLLLRYSLAEMVQKRWPGRFKNIRLCPVCSHPRRVAIERILAEKKAGESWGTLNKRLRKSVGKTFNPPSILINHLKYHMKG